ncbi:MAG: hypothetical protein JXA46_05660 [Dehalococcoidales bacterium]|nr:hypothetical protein [Dehalococcoidales bacterium]
MAESKYGKYIITESNQEIALPSYRSESKKAEQQPAVPGGKPRKRPTRLMWLDSAAVPGAFYSECVWIWPECASEEKAAQAHTHPFDEIITFYGTNPDDPEDLCGEAELWLEDEKHIMTKSFLAFVPAGMKHCPLIVRRVDRPIIHFTIGRTTKYE